jgi:hypothetical protein
MGQTVPAGEAGAEGLATETDATSAADELAATGILPDELGIYGNPYELNIDVSRIPRYEEYDLALEMGAYTAVGSLGDVKTVSYFLVGGPNSSYGNYGASSYGAGSAAYGFGSSSYGTSGYGGSSYGMSGYAATGYGTSRLGGLNSPWQNAGGTAYSGGLARRVVDRSAARFAQENGNYQWLDLQTELFAPEVVALEFAYFNGLEWLLEWDTQQDGGLPLAIEIVLVVRADPEVPPVTTPLAGTGIRYGQNGLDHVYRLVVHLPAADPLTENTLTEDTLTEEGGL